MSKATETFKADLEKDLAALRTVRDEVHVKLHLAAMDARDAFRRLESDADAVTRDASARLRALIERMRAVAASIDAGKGGHAGR